MAQQTQYKAYHAASQTVAKTRQVVMLYDGAIRFLHQAREAIEAGDIETRYHKLTKVTDIITGLQSCLDYQAGQETAKILNDFYTSIEMRVFQLHHVPSGDACRQIAQELKEMRDVWDAIDRGKDGQEASSATDLPGEQRPPAASVDTIVVSA